MIQRGTTSSHGSMTLSLFFHVKELAGTSHCWWNESRLSWRLHSIAVPETRLQWFVERLFPGVIWSLGVDLLDQWGGSEMSCRIQTPLPFCFLPSAYFSWAMISSFPSGHHILPRGKENAVGQLGQMQYERVVLAESSLSHQDRL